MKRQTPRTNTTDTIITDTTPCRVLDERIRRVFSRERDRGRKRTYQRTDLIARIGTRCVDGKPVGNITPRRQRQVLALVADTQRDPVPEDEHLRGARSRLGLLLPGLGKKAGPQSRVNDGRPPPEPNGKISEPRIQRSE